MKNTNKLWERDNRPISERNLDDRDPRTQTFNEDEISWRNKNHPEETKEDGTPGNNWDARDPMQRTPGWEDEEERSASAGDYINTDHSDYNRGNSRYGWYEPEE